MPISRAEPPRDDLALERVGGERQNISLPARTDVVSGQIVPEKYEELKRLIRRGGLASEYAICLYWRGNLIFDDTRLHHFCGATGIYFTTRHK